MTRSELTLIREYRGAACSLDVDAIIRRGRRRRRLRTAGVSAAVAAVVGAGVGGAVAISRSSTPRDQVVSPLSRPTPAICNAVGDTPTGEAFWDSWPRCRVSGHLPRPSFFQGREGSPTLATGQLPDGSEYVVQEQVGPGGAKQADFSFGWHGWDFAGEFAGNGRSGSPDAGYLSLDFPTFQTANRLPGSTTAWLVIVAKPGTTQAQYSPDGTDWQQMTLQNGIAVLKIPNYPPPSEAMLRLSDHNGRYVDGPMAYPAAMPLPAAGAIGTPN